MARPSAAGPASPAEAEPGSPPDGERRQLTVLFSDLVGSTAMASRLDPEDFREVVSAYQEACSAAVERFGGYVAQSLGDGLVVYFGYPTAHEDDALRAVRGGLGIVDAVAALAPRVSRLGVALAVRVGVHTGTVVVGAVGPRTRRETLALGETTSIAARLQEAAEPSSVVISATTFRLVHSQFVTEERGVHVLKGIPDPVVLYRAVRPLRVKSTHARTERGRGGNLVGRAPELRRLRALWENARAGEGKVVILSGDGGIGKTRLAAALRSELRGEPHTWLECRASAFREDTPLHGIVALQEEAFGLTAFESPAQKAACIERALVDIGMRPAEHLPLFADLHSLPLPARYSALPSSPEASRRRLLESLTEWLLRSSDAQPVVLLVEDLNWVDPTTLELVERLVERAPEKSMLLFLTHRPDFAAPFAASPHVESVALGRLDRKSAEDLVLGIEAAYGALPDDVTTEILSRADGVPLFLEELTRTVIDASRAERDGPGPHPTVVPSTLKDSLMARLDGLGSGKELVQLCAAFGREFSSELVRATTTLGESELAVALGALVASDLLTRRGEPPVFAFRHALLQEEAYDSLLKTTRQTLHGRIAEAISTRFPEVAAREPELLAHHLGAAGLAEQALGYWILAGQKSLARSANVEASRQLARGLLALERLPRSPERNQQELFLLTMRGVALIAARGYGSSEVEQAFARARVLCQELGDTPHLFPVLFGLTLFYLVRSKSTEANQLAEQLDAVAARAADVEVTLETHSARAALSFWEGHFAASREHILEARALFDPARHAHHVLVYGQDPRAYGYSYESLALWFLGYPEQALLAGRKAVELAEEARHPPTLAGVLSFYGDLQHHLRRPELFADITKRTVAVADEQNLPMWIATARTQRGWALCQLGDPDAGIAEIVGGLASFRKTGAEINAAYMVSRLVEAYLAAGRIHEGLAQVDEALVRVSSTLDRYYEAELHRLRGELLHEGGQDGAETSFRRALAVARTQGARALELRAAMSLCRLLRGTEGGTEARETLTAVYGSFTEGFDTPDLVEAASHVVDRAGESSPRGPRE